MDGGGEESSTFTKRASQCYIAYLTLNLMGFFFKKSRKFHSSSFLFQPIFLNWSTPHFRVLSAHRPFQELKIIPEMTQDVLTKLLSLSN